MKIIHVVCATSLLLLTFAFPSTATLQTSEGCGPGKDAPWFNPGANCRNRQKTFVFSGQVNWPKRNETNCYLYIHICNLVIKQNTVQTLGTKCPVGSETAQPVVCCDEFKKAVNTKLPCDPMTDADCDGVPNDQDKQPLRSEPVYLDADHKCGHLGQDVFTAYKKAGASDDTAAHAGQNAREECRKKRAAKTCGSGWNDDAPSTAPVSFPANNDGDDRCKQLGQDVYDAYLKAGANRDTTAAQAGEAARSECIKKKSNVSPL